MKRIYFAALVGLFGCVSALSAQGRSELLLEKNWKSPAKTTMSL